MMTWTTTAPTEPGWYWFRNLFSSSCPYPQICRVEIIHGKPEVLYPMGWDGTLNTHFAGPIPEPEEA